jgi:DNA-binding beta-propeller fold protein YncE
MRWSIGLVALLTCVAGVRADRLVLFAGGGDGGDGAPAVKAKLTQPFGIGFDAAGNAYLVELAGERLLKVDKAGIFHILAGTGKKGPGDDGPAKTTSFNGMHSLAVLPTDGVFVADTWNGRIRRYDPKTETIAAVAGKSRTGKAVYAGDGGPALEAVFSGIYSISMTAAGDKIYLADLENRRIRVVDLKAGTVELVAGNGVKGTPTDGAVAKESPLVDPRACLVDPKGNVYILERSGNALRVVDSAGKIRTLVSGPKGGLNGPKHLCLDLDGNVIIADTGNHVIRKYDVTTGALTRIAGTGKKGDSGTGGPPLEVNFNEPHGVHVQPDGTLYIVDSMNGRVFRWEKDRR